MRGERNMSMSKHRYPFFVEIFKGEGRMLFVPYIDHIGGNLVELGENYYTVETEDERVIGQIVLDIIEKIKCTSLSEATGEELAVNMAWKNNSKYKNWISFWKNNNNALVRFYEDGHYRIYSSARSSIGKGNYGECLEIVELLPVVEVEDIGKAIIKVFRTAEEYHNNNKDFEKISTKEVQMLDGKILKIFVPNNSHFIDNADSGAAEIYQCYSYSTSENSEPVAEFFLGIAPELDCNLQPENVRNSWEEYYGVADYFEMQEVDYGIFKFRIEMRNKDSHKISYILQQDEDLLLECGMEVHSPNRRKKTDEKLKKMFEEFALSCKL